MAEKTLDGVLPLQAKVSRKRWANLRSDFAAAIAEPDLIPMLKTSDLKLSKEWEICFDTAKDKRITNGLLRFRRWASLNELGPANIKPATFERFFAELA